MAMMSAPTEVFTFVFTDIEGSTERALRLGDGRWSELLRRHHRVVREVIAAHGGREVKDLGDGFMVVFDDPASGVGFAADLLDRMAGVELPVRIGVHTGEAIPEGTDFIGVQVNLTSRIAAAASGGQALITAATVEALGSTAASLGLGSERRLRLRGMPGTHVAFPIGTAGPVATHATETPLVGRATELARLRTALDTARSGRPQLVTVLGEPGSGKTHIVRQLVNEARRSGVATHWGRCWDRPGAPEYVPWRRLITSILKGHRDELARLAGLAGLAPLGHLVPELAEICGPPPTMSADPETARFELFDAVRALLSGFAAESPVILVLEDMHSSDQASLDLLGYLMHSIENAPILVLATCQSVDPEAVRRLRAVDHGATSVVVGRLNDEEVGLLLVELAHGVVPDHTTAAIVDATDGNPFYVTELALALARGETALVPGGVQRAIEQRVGLLSAPAAALVEVAAVLGNSFDLAPLRIASGEGGSALAQHLDEAVRRGLVHLHDDLQTGRFVHGIVHHAVYEGIPPHRRAELHGVVGGVIEKLDHRTDRHVAEIAWHFVRAAAAGYADRTVDACRRAGAIARNLQAYAEAVAHFEAASAALAFANQPNDAIRAELTVDLGEALVRAGDRERASGALHSGVNAALDMDNADLAARAMLAWPPERAAPEWMAEGLVDQVLGTTSDASLTARLRAVRCWLLGGADDDRAGDEAESTVSLAESIGDTPTTVGVLRTILQSGDAAGSPWYMPAVDRLDELSRSTGLLSGSMAASFYRGHHLLLHGDGDGAGEAFADQLLRADRMGEPLAQIDGRLRVAALHLMRGAGDEYERLLAEASSIAEGLGDELSRHALFGLVWVANHDQGTLADLAPLLPALDSASDIPNLREAAALIHLTMGDPRPARSMIADPPQRPYGGGRHYWRAATVATCEAAVELSDGAAAGLLAKRLEGERGLVATVPGSSGVLAVVDHVVGRARRVAGDIDGAIEALSAAVETCRTLRASRHEAKALIDLADALIDRGATEDVASADTMLGEAAALPGVPLVRGLGSRLALIRDRISL